MTEAGGRHVSLSEVRRIARKRPEQEFVLNRLYGAHVSPYFTVLCLRLGLSPDQVTIVGAAFGAVGVGLLFLPLGWWTVVAVVSNQVGYVLDFSDGQVARFTGWRSAAGSYLDWLARFEIAAESLLALVGIRRTAQQGGWSARAGCDRQFTSASLPFSAFTLCGGRLSWDSSQRLKYAIMSVGA